MDTDTAILLALITTLLAVLAAVTAAVGVTMVRRGRRGSRRATGALERAHATFHAGLTSTRGTIDQVAATIARARSQGVTLDADMATWSTGLHDLRTTIHRLTRGRLGPAVRALQVAGALARVALLWRTPAR